MKTFKRIMTIILAMILSVLIIGKVSSYSMGQTVYLGLEDLKSSSDLYCVQHHANLSGRVPFQVRGHVRIKGNQVEGGYTDPSNGVISYILSQGGGYSSNTQHSLWAYYNTWASTAASYRYAGIEGVINPPFSGNASNDPGGLIEKGKAYADQVGNGETGVSTNDGMKAMPYIENNEPFIKVGPFIWTFPGQIEGIKVFADNGTEVTKMELIDANSKKIQVSDIKSGKAFYLKMKFADVTYDSITKIEAKIKGGVIYTTDMWFLYNSDKQNVIAVETSKENLDITKNFEYKIRVRRDIEIEKVDSRDKRVTLPNVGFILKHKEFNKYVKKGGNATYSYVDKKEDATEFRTDENGKISLKGLIVGTYLAYETENPNYGYKQISGDIQIAENEDKKQIENEQVYVKLSGYIWLDVESTKLSYRNGWYKTDAHEDGGEYVDSEDKAFDGILVILKDRRTNQIVVKTSYEGKPITDASGNAEQYVTVSAERGLYDEIDGGEYIFEDILIEELPNYYVEFEYNGLIYQSVPNPNIEIIKKANSLDKEHNTFNVSTASRGTDKVQREILDNNFKTVDSTGTNAVNVNNTYTITYTETKDHAASILDSSQCMLRANTNDTGLNIENLFKPGREELRHINLGLYERPQADMDLGQDIAEVTVGVNGYRHVYKYGSKHYERNDAESWNVGVKFKNEITETYKRAVYPEDVGFVSEDKNKEIQVYITYALALRNSSPWYTRVNRITQYFDNKYSIAAVGTELDETTNTVSGNVGVRDLQQFNSEYNRCTLEPNILVAPGETGFVYIQFKLEKEAVVQILNQQETLYTVSEIDSYTSYYDAGNKTVAAVDIDSVPGNAVLGNIDTYEDDTSAGGPILLELTDERELYGTVFVDSTSGELKTGEVRQGDGIFNEGEQTISGVVVTLKSNGETIRNPEGIYVNEITTTTDAQGNYKFDNYVPAQYTITYTWGDKTYTVQNYKATVYNNQERLYRVDPYNNPWYKDIDPRFSDALDDYEIRKQIDAELSTITDHTANEQIKDLYEGGNNHQNLTITKMNSTTPVMEVSVEYDTNVTDGTDDKVVFIVKNVDFGIAERARQKLDLRKRVSSFKLTLANGQVVADVLIDENGKLTGSSNYVTYMPPSVVNGYSDTGYVRAELDNELIDGATLQVSYALDAINNSELDYMSPEFYNFGTLKGNVATITPAKLVDYLDGNLAFEQEKNPDWKKITINDLKQLNAAQLDLGEEYLNTRLFLYTESINKELKPTEKSSVSLYVSKLLASSKDMTYLNDAEITTASKPSGGTTHTGNAIEEFPVSSAEEVIITPSTGANKDYILPVVTVVVALSILGLGSFIIKKKVIDAK